jgi:hypothetical protein
VFIDISSVEAGSDFRQRIEQALGSCELALVLIGPYWLTPQTADNERRIDAEDDVVRYEVRAALDRPDVTVIPVLVEGAKMPSAAELPPEISSLAKFNAYDLSNKRWQYDLEQLTALARRFDTWWGRLRFRAPRLLWRAAPVAALLIAVGVGIATGFSSGSGSAGTKSGPRQISQYDGIAGHFTESRALLAFLTQHDGQPVYLHVGFPQLDTGPGGGPNVITQTVPFRGGTTTLITEIDLMTVCSSAIPATVTNPTPRDGCMGTGLMISGPQTPGAQTFFEHGVPVLKGYFAVDVTGNLHQGITAIILKPVTLNQARQM